MQKTNIEYLDYTWNPIAMRCTPCSPGCDYCWHLRMADRLCKNPSIPEEERRALAGEGPPVLRERELTAPSNLRKPSVIGVQFMGDIFHNGIPWGYAHCVWDAMKAAPQHTFVALTKRPAIAKKVIEHTYSLERTGRDMGFLSHVWLGVTVCNQDEADKNIPLLLQTPASHRWVSIEPMLGGVEFNKLPNMGPCSSSCREFLLCRESKKWICHNLRRHNNYRIDLVVLGGETGPKARPMHPDWARKVRDDCSEAGTDFFFKGWGSWGPCTVLYNSLVLRHPALFVDRITGETKRQHIKSIPDGHFPMQRGGSIGIARTLDGRTHDDLPWKP